MEQKKTRLTIEEMPVSEIGKISVAEYGKSIRKNSQSKFWMSILILVLIDFGAFQVSEFPELAQHPDIKKILHEMSTVFTVTIATSLIFELALRRTFFKEINFEIWNGFHQFFGNASSINRSGIEVVHDHFPAKRIEEGFAKAEREIVIVHTWFSNISPIEESIVTAFKKSDDCTAKIFLVDPDCEMAKHRSAESGLMTENILPDSVKQAENMMNAMSLKIGNGRCSHRIGTFRYRCTPTISIFMYDDKLFWGPLFKGKRTWDTTWFELTSEKTPLHTLLKSYIKYIEENALEYIPPAFAAKKKLYGKPDDVVTATTPKGTT